MNYTTCEAYLSRHLFLIALFIVVITATAYSGALYNGFVWDDHDVIENYPLNSSIGNLPQLFVRTDSISGWPKTPFYRPLARATFVMDRQIFGLRAWCYHAENLLIHLANVLLLFLVARSLFREVAPSLLTAALFAVHPGICEPVFALFARNTLLSFLFMMTTLLTFQRGMKTHRYRWFALSAVCFFLGSLSKEMTIMVLPLLGWLQFRFGGEYPLKGMVLRMAPFLTALIVYLLMRNNALALEQIPPLSFSGLASRLTNNIYIIPRYLLLAAWPAQLTVWHTIPTNLQPLTALIASGWVALAAGTYAVIRYGGTTMKFGLFWGACLLVPVLGIWAVPGAPMAERHLYGPFAGFSLVVAAAGVLLIRKRPIACAAIACCLLALLTLRTIDRGGDWRNDITLFRSATQAYPDSVNAHYNLGEAYETSKNKDAALIEWLTVIQLSPNDIDALSKVGTHYFGAGQYDKALPYFERAAAVRPDIYGLMNNLGSTLDILGRPGEAIQRYEQALRSLPPHNTFEINRLRGRIRFLRDTASK